MDPRKPTKTVPVVAFDSSGEKKTIDGICRASFLGNFYDMGADGLSLQPPGSPGSAWFCNAEAGFQALKFWSRAAEFRFLSGEEAFKKTQLQDADPDYAGWGSNWKAMRSVLKAKFQRGSPLTEALLRTEDAYLLNCNPVEGRDDIWSDNKFGFGRNWLGLQLMLVRDEIRGSKFQRGSWTAFVASYMNTDEGELWAGRTLSEWYDIFVKPASNVALAKVVGQSPQQTSRSGSSCGGSASPALIADSAENATQAVARHGELAAALMSRLAQQLHKAHAAAEATSAEAGGGADTAAKARVAADEAAKSLSEAVAVAEALAEAQFLASAAVQAEATVAAASVAEANRERDAARDAQKREAAAAAVAKQEQRRLQQEASKIAAAVAASEKAHREETAAAVAAADQAKQKTEEVLAAARQARQEQCRMQQAAAWELLSRLESDQTRRRLQPLQPSDPRHALISKLFADSCSSHRQALGSKDFCPPPDLVLSEVALVCNPGLAKQYHLTRERIAERHSAKTCDRLPVFQDFSLPCPEGCERNWLNEVLLFHGAPLDIVDGICREGFDPRRGGEATGAMFGIGTYFAANASKADIYTETHSNKLRRRADRKLLVARVLLGEAYRATKPMQGVQRPPDCPDGKLHDSVWADIRANGGAVDHLEAIVYDRGQAVPVSVITYHHADSCKCAECGKRPA